LHPGGGYFYTGHPVAAIFPAVAETIFLLDVLVILIAGFSSPTAPPELMTTLAILAVFWTLETAVTILPCRRFVREFIPLRRAVAAVPPTELNETESRDGDVDGMVAGGARGPFGFFD